MLVRFRVLGVQGFGFRVWDLGFRVDNVLLLKNSTDSLSRSYRG